MYQRKIIQNIMIATVALFLFQGCASTKVYSYKNESNLQIVTELDAGSSTTLKGYMGVYHVDKACKLQWQGVITLNKAVINAALPQDKPSYLVFHLEKSQFLGANGSLKEETFVPVKKGHHYRAKFSYIEGLYEFTLSEKDAKRKKYKELPFVGLDSCRPRV